MSTKATPQVTEVAEKWEAGVVRIRKGKLAAQQGDTSDPPATASEEEERQPPKLQQRTKRKFEGKDDDSRTIIIEMRRLFDNFTAQQEKKMEAFEKKFDFLEKCPEELMAIREQIAEGRVDMANFIESCDAGMGRFETRLAEAERKLEEKVPDANIIVEKAVAELKQQLNERDQELLLNDLEISGVPESPQESTIHLVKLLAANLSIELDERDIVHAARVGPVTRNRVENGGRAQADRPRNIVVRLARRTTRDSVLQAARVRRGLTATNLGVAGEPARRVYVNEHLTRTNRQLFGRAREHARRLGWKYVWTRDGKIFARKEDGKPVERLRAERDLQKIFGPNIV